MAVTSVSQACGVAAATIFFRGKKVAVAGGGNTAVEEALFLTNFADKVTLVHRRDTLRADKTNQARLAANKKIHVLYDTEIAEVLGSETPKGVSGVRLRNTITGSLHDETVDGLFIAIGHSPATGLFHGSWRWMKAATSGRRRIRPTHRSQACSQPASRTRSSARR